MLYRTPATASGLYLLLWSQLLGAQTSSTVSLYTSPNPSVYGAPVTMTATVTPFGATGRVTFYDGVSILGVSTISGGQALFTTRLLASGSRSMRAHYAGDASHAPSNSAPVTQSVKPVAAASLHAPVGFFAALDPISMATGDFNRDGILDLVICGSDGDLVALLSNGDGTFQGRLVYREESIPWGVAAGDLNGDGIPDLVTTSDSGMVILIGNGDGTFAVGNSYPLTASGRFAIGDFNGDG